MSDLTAYAVGGATRPDSFSGMDERFSSALAKMFADAPEDIRSGLKVSSGYRSKERQAQLWADALKKYGSPEKARKWVAPPGNSKHNHGSAADLKYLDPKAKEWVHANASKYGLAFPLNHEDWHVELAGARMDNIERAPLPDVAGTGKEDLKARAKKELMRRKAKAELERRKAAKAEPTTEQRAPNSEFGTLTGTEPSALEKVGNALFDAGKAIGLPVDRMRRDNAAIDAGVRGAADIATFGLSDEISAGAGAVTGIGGERGNYSGNLEYQRAQDEYDAEVNPEARFAGQLAGGMLLGRFAPAPAPNAWGRIKQGATLGAGAGGAYGFGSGEGVENRALGAVKGAAAGAFIGAAIPAATSGARTAYNTMMDYTVRPATNAIRSTVNPAQNAMQLTRRALARDGLEPEQAAMKMQQAIDAGDDTMMLMDVAGDNSRRLGRFASNIPGEGADKIKQAVFDRQLAQPERVIGAIREGLDDPERYFGTIDDIIAQRQQAAAPLYEKAWNTPVPFTRKLEGLLGRGKVMRDALRRARDLGEAEGIPSKQFFARIADDGSYTIESVPDARQWDLMKRSLDDIIESEKTVMPNGSEKLSNVGRVVSGIKREMLEEIDRVNPDYAAARKVYSSASESLDSVEQGKKLLDADPELARRKLAGMSEGDKQLARLGLSKAMSDRVMRMKDGANTVRAIFASPKHRAVLKEAFPDEKSFADFQDAMEREAQKTRTKTAIQGNSTTAQQLTDIADNQIDTGVVGNLLAGRPVAAAGAAVQKALSRATVVNEATAKEIADILTTTDPKAAQQILSEMQRLAMKDQRVAKNLMAVRALLRNTGVLTATTQATEALVK